MAAFGRRLRTPALLIQWLVRIHRTFFRKLAAPFHFRKLSCNIEHWVDNVFLEVFILLDPILNLGRQMWPRRRRHIATLPKFGCSPVSYTIHYFSV